MTNLLFLLLSIFSQCIAYQILRVDNEFLYELYEPQDLINPALLEEARAMYLDAYLHPPLHIGWEIPILQLGEMQFATYEEFIEELFRQDFESYQFPSPRYYFQIRSLKNQQIVAVCTCLAEDKIGHYYIDHLGVHKDFRRRQLGSSLLTEALNALPDL